MGKFCHFILYGNNFGFYDLECVEKALKKNICKKIIVFLKTNPHKNIMDRLKSEIAIQFKINKNPKKAAKEYYKYLHIKNKDITIKFLPLEVIADRSMFYDVG